jgi:hypothetical protein
MSVDAPADVRGLKVGKYTTFTWVGNSCFIDTFLEQTYWLRTRLGCTPPQHFFDPVSPGWDFVLERMDATHIQLQHIDMPDSISNYDGANRDTLMRTRTEFRNKICHFTDDLKGCGEDMGDVTDLWYTLSNPQLCLPADPDVFGERMKSSSCMGCFPSATSLKKSERAWRCMFMGNMAVNTAVALGLSANACSDSAYYGMDLWSSLQGNPCNLNAVKCTECPKGHAYPMQIEGPRKVLICILPRGEVGQPNSTKVSFREWESIIVGDELVCYKAIADGRLESLHWTCVVDVDLKSHTERKLQGTWYMMDDREAPNPAALQHAGWTEYEQYRSMVIYVRIASRKLTQPELESERARLTDMAHRVEALRTDKIKKDMEEQRMTNVVEGDASAHPISF